MAYEQEHTLSPGLIRPLWTHFHGHKLVICKNFFYFYLQVRLCSSIHTRVQVVHDETEHCHSLVPEADEFFVEHMRRLGLSHLIDVPTVDMPHFLARDHPEGVIGLPHCIV